MAGAGFRCLVSDGKTGGARLCRSAEALPRNLRHPPRVEEAPAGRCRRISSSASMRRISISAWKRRSSSAASRPSTTSARRSGPGAASGSRRSAARSIALLALFPFEPALYEKQGIPVSYVGHPLADMMPLETSKLAVRDKLLDCRATAGFRPAAGQPPGRTGDTWPTPSSQTAKVIREHHLPNAHVPGAAGDARNAPAVRNGALSLQQADDLPFRLLFGHAQDALVPPTCRWWRAARRRWKRRCSSGRWSSPTRWRRSSYWLVQAHGQSALCRPAQYPGRAIRGAGIHAGRRDAGESCPGAGQALRRQGERRGRSAETFPDIHLQLRQNTAEKAASGGHRMPELIMPLRLKASSAASTRPGAGRWPGRWWRRR